MRFPPYGQNKSVARSYCLSRQTDLLLSFIPVKVRELVLKDLRYLYRSQVEILEGVMQMIFAAGILILTTYTGHRNHRELLETGPMMVVMILSIFGVRTIFQTCFDDRKLTYLLFRTLSPNTFLNWKWATSFGVMSIRIIITLCIAELVTSMFFPFDINPFSRAFLMALLYSASFSLLGLNIAFKHLRRDSARLLLPGWIEYAFTTSLSLGVGVLYLLAFPILKIYSHLQILCLTLFIGLLLVIYLLANKRVKRFAYE